MSAVMSTLSMISGGRRSHPKLSKKSSRNSGQYSDAGEERTPRRELREQRSASLQTLESPGSGGGGGGVQHLETLEAKMASIEVSLSTRARRSGGGAEGAAVGAAAGVGVAAGAAPARELDALRTALRDKDSLIQSLKEQLCTTHSINRISASLSRAASPVGGGGGGGGGGALTRDERRTLEERADATRRDADGRRAAIAALKQALQRLHVTDNIDTRIQQAELEYQLGREELQLLTLMEQSRALQLLIEQADAAHHRQTLYSCVREMGGASIVAAEAEGDCKSPRFGAGPRRGAPGLWVEWARDDVPLCKGDRVVEANGVPLVSCRSAEELWRALAISPRPARLVLLRPAPSAAAAPPAPAAPPQVVTMQAEMGALREQAGEARRAKEELRADNLRLTHRISYLEEQVAELLSDRAPPGTDPEQVKVVTAEEHCVMSRVKSKRNVTNISITSSPDGNGAAKSDVQVFQKGPDITALVANMPGLDAGAPSRPRSSMSSASGPRRSLDVPHQCRDKGRHSLSQHSLRALDYQAETAAALEIIRNNQRQYIGGSEQDFYDGSRGATDGDATRLKKTNWAERKTLSIIEQLKQSQRLRKSKGKTKSVEDVDFDPDRDYVYHRIDGKVLENTHKSNRRLSKMHARNVKSLEFESESDFPNGDISDSPRPVDYSSEPGAVKLGHYRKHGQGAEAAGDGKTRPLPPKKPLRLSLHRAHSSHSVGTELDAPELRKTTKRSHKGERGPPPPPAPANALRSPGGRATPKPSKKLLDGLSPYEAPATAADVRCAARGDSPRRPTASPLPHPRTPTDHFRFNGHLSRAKWC